MVSRLLKSYRQAFAGLPRGVWYLALVTVVHRSGTMVLPFLSLYVTKDLGLTPRHAGAWRDRPFVALVCLVTVLSIVFFQLLATFPLTLHDVFNLEERTIGALFAINTLLIVVFEMVLVHAAGRFHPVRVAALGALLTCLGLGALPLGSSLAFVCFTIVVWTVGEMLSHPMLEGLAASRGPAASRGAYLGLYNATFALSFVLGPPLGTWVYASLGYRTLWFGCAALGVVLAAGFWALSRPFGRPRQAGS